MRLIIAGSRDFNDYNLLCGSLYRLLSGRLEEIEIVSGGCRGADELGELFAKQHGYQIKRFPADWNKYGKAAGPIRNKQMAEYATDAIVFVSEGSRGSKDMIKQCEAYGIPCTEINI